MILTNDRKIYNECLFLREFGRINQDKLQSERYYSDKKKNKKIMIKRYVFTKIGYNVRMRFFKLSFRS